MISAIPPHWHRNTTLCSQTTSFTTGEAWARELDYNYVWTNVTDAYNLTQTSGSTSNFHPCFADRDGDGLLDSIDPNPDVPDTGFTPDSNSFGLCSHRWDDVDAAYDFSEDYNLLTAPRQHSTKSLHSHQLKIDIQSSHQHWIRIWIRMMMGSTPAFEAAGIQGDEQGPFAVYARICSSRLCGKPSSGQVHIASDGSLLINAIYSASNIENSAVPKVTGGIWALDIIADALLVGNESLTPSDDAVVIFDESRHQRQSSFRHTT